MIGPRNKIYGRSFLEITFPKNLFDWKSVDGSFNKKKFNHEISAMNQMDLPVNIYQIKKKQVDSSFENNILGFNLTTKFEYFYYELSIQYQFFHKNFLKLQFQLKRFSSF